MLRGLETAPGTVDPQDRLPSSSLAAYRIGSPMRALCSPSYLRAAEALCEAMATVARCQGAAGDPRQLVRCMSLDGTDDGAMGGDHGGETEEGGGGSRNGLDGREIEWQLGHESVRTGMLGGEEIEGGGEEDEGAPEGSRRAGDAVVALFVRGRWRRYVVRGGRLPAVGLVG